MMPYWRLSGFYFFYFATIGALIPYWGSYLKSINFSASEIGQLIALMLLSRIVAPNIWRWIADACGLYFGLFMFAASPLFLRRFPVAKTSVLFHGRSWFCRLHG